MANVALPATVDSVGCEAHRVADEAAPDFTTSSRDAVHEYDHVEYNDNDADTICLPVIVDKGKFRYERATIPPPLYVPARSSLAVE